MRKIALLATAAALAVPAVALADDGAPAPTPTPTPVVSCKQQRTEMGVVAFRDLFGTNHHKRNALGKCVSKQKHLRHHEALKAKANAIATCHAEQAADAAAFAAKYGTPHHKRNAFGKCVSQHAKAAGDDAAENDNEGTIAAAKACADERTADPAAFAAKYGTNHNKRNAFGKCVSQHARDHHGDNGDQGDQGDDNETGDHGDDGDKTPPTTTTTTTTPAPTPEPTPAG
jgi:hypothetical protein